MIIEELFEINGTQHVRHYSDSGVMIERDGVTYEVAEDPVGTGRTYTETDIPIEGGDTAEEIVSILLGGEE